MASNRKPAAADDKPKVNKAELVRQYRAANPNAKPKEIVEALAAQGVKINPNYVATVRYHEEGKNKKKGGEVTVAELTSAHALVNELGGVEKVRASLETSKRFCEVVGDHDRAEKVVASLSVFLDSLNAPQQQD